MKTIVQALMFGLGVFALQLVLVSLLTFEKETFPPYTEKGIQGINLSEGWEKPPHVTADVCLTMGIGASTYKKGLPFVYEKNSQSNCWYETETNTTAQVYNYVIYTAVAIASAGGMYFVLQRRQSVT